MRRKILRCPCGARHNVPEGATRIICPKCGRIFGQPKHPLYLKAETQPMEFRYDLV